MAPKPADPERVTTVEKGLVVVQEATSRRSVKTWLGLRGELGKVRTQLEDVQAALWRMEALLAARPMAGEAEWGRDGKRRDGERRDRVPRGEESQIATTQAEWRCQIGQIFAGKRRFAKIEAARGCSDARETWFSWRSA